MGILVKPVRNVSAASAVGMADALFTKVQQRVLAVLFGNPDRSFYANEVIALAATGTGAVQRELARLQSSGLVTVQQIGRQKHYQANRASPVFEELRGLVRKTVGLLDVLRAVLQPLEDRVLAAFVYGSVAKGSDAAASDIDLMFVSDELTYIDLFAALEPAARAVNPTVYSRAELARRIEAKNSFVCRVLEQDKIWVIGGEDDIESG
jgi:predicted nucleotidyltransferase